MKQSPEEIEINISKVIIAYKFFLGLFEVLLGLGIVIFGKYILDLYQNFIYSEILDDPSDLLVSILDKIVPYLFAHQGFIVFFLLLIGVTKMVGAAGLFYRKHWGLDILVAVTIILLPFELFNLIAHPSFSKVIYFLVNMFIALYLVNFKPHHYFIHAKKRYTG